jgi:hypothetical protein
VTERFNRTLKAWLNNHQNDWEQKISDVLFHYRVTKHSSTHVSPFELVYGRDATTLLDVYTSTKFDGPLSDIERRRLEEKARTSSEKTHKRNKRNYDMANKTVNWRAYKPGDLVRMKDHGRPQVTGPGASKFRKKWSGPFAVLDVRGTSCKLDHGPRGRWVNAKNLTSWYTRGKQFKGGVSVVGARNFSDLINQ